MAVTTWQVSAVKDPLGPGYIGMATGNHFDGTPMTIYTMNEAGQMVAYKTPEAAKNHIQKVMIAMASFRFKTADEITPEAIAKELRDEGEAGVE